MNKTYLLSKKIYAYDVDEKHIYQLESAITHNYDGCDTIELSFVLVTAWDYIDPDCTNEQGWTAPDRFIEDIQSMSMSQYYLQESAIECIIANGYEILEKLPVIR